MGFSPCRPDLRVEGDYPLGSRKGDVPGESRPGGVVVTRLDVFTVTCFDCGLSTWS